MNFRAKYKPEPLAFQVVPMIDILFLLLCFFVTSQIYSLWESEIDITLPTAQTATTNTSEMAAMIGHGLRLGLAGGPWFHGTEPERCCGTGMLGGGTPQLLYCGAA